MGIVNPSPDSWCLPLVEYYLTDDGLPDPDKCGDIRWFIIKDNEFIFGTSEEWFQENHPDSLWITVPNQEEKMYVRPKKFTYIFFNIFDNPLGLQANPVYLSELNNLPDHERDTQLWGNWYSAPRGTSIWRREWVRGENGERVKTYKDIPEGVHWYRGHDKGYSEPSEVHKYPDFTAASPKIGKDREGHYWVVGDYHPEFFDVDQTEVPERNRVYGKFRKLAGERDTLIIKQAEFDGDDTSVVLTKDTGGAASDHAFTKSRLVERSIKVIEDKSAKNTPGKKIKDFQPFCNACMIGLVYIVEDSFNPATLNAWYKELELFTGEPSTSTRKDDWVDSSAMTFAAAATGRVFRSINRNQKRNNTYSSEVIRQEIPKHSEGIDGTKDRLSGL